MKRFLSIISLLIGLTAIGAMIAACLGQGIVEAFTGYAAAPTIICLAAGVAFTVLGVSGNVRLSRKERKLSEEERVERKKKNRSIYIFSGILTATVAVLICVICGWPSIQKGLEQIQVDKQLAVSEILGIDPLAETSGGSAMPDGARYLLYDMDKRSYDLDPKTQLLNGITSKPKIAAVLVRYRISTEEIGAWYTVPSNIYIEKAYGQTIHIEVIGIADWSLIASTSIEALRTDDALDNGYTYKISIYSDNVRQYLNGLFE